MNSGNDKPKRPDLFDSKEQEDSFLGGASEPLPEPAGHGGEARQSNLRTNAGCLAVLLLAASPVILMMYFDYRAEREKDATRALLATDFAAAIASFPKAGDRSREVIRAAVDERIRKAGFSPYDKPFLLAEPAEALAALDAAIAERGLKQRTAKAWRADAEKRCAPAFGAECSKIVAVWACVDRGDCDDATIEIISERAIDGGWLDDYYHDRF